MMQDCDCSLYSLKCKQVCTGAWQVQGFIDCCNTDTGFPMKPE